MPKMPDDIHLIVPGETSRRRGSRPWRETLGSGAAWRLRRGLERSIDQ